MRRGDFELGGVAISIVAFWAALLYFLVNPWFACGWLVFCIALGLLIFLSYRNLEVKEPEPGEMAEVTEFSEALKCRGRAPLDRHYSAVERRKAS